MPLPEVSIIIPLYESQATLGDCLLALKRQTFHDFEVILVDSSPHDTAAEVARQSLPCAIYLRAGRRLLSQAARNFGAERSRGGLLVFTDPDIYPAADWLERLVATWSERPGAVVLGSIACHDRRWLDRGIHLCKFNICLPGGEARAVSLGWSGNVLMDRQLFESMGGWSEAVTQGDSIFTARAHAAGHILWFEPRALVVHDHERVRFLDFIRERYRRGREFAELDAAGNLETRDLVAGASFRPQSISVMLLTPLRIINRLLFIARAAANSHLAIDYWLTLPVVLSGVSAWYAGIWSHHWNRLIHGERPTSSG
jgi:glycosyltransferase involved in cell wall biosynthesis